MAIPNGGVRPIGMARTLKRTGVLPGVPDLFIPHPAGPFHGLWIEMKTPKGVVSILQKEVMAKLVDYGYCVHVIRDYNSFQSAVKTYFNLEKD